MKILVVCLGNICRSPTAEAVLRSKALQLNIPCIIDAAGTISLHQGALPDERARRTAESKGYSFAGIRSRRISTADFSDFDFILAADKYNFADLKAQCPVHLHYKISLFLSHGDSPFTEIPDPYYGGKEGVEQVLALIENAAEHILLNLCNNN